MFLFNLLFLGLNLAFAGLLVVAAMRVANHLKNNPAATQALVEHIFVPVFRTPIDGTDESEAPPERRVVESGLAQPNSAPAARKK